MYWFEVWVSQGGCPGLYTRAYWPGGILPHARVLSSGCKYGYRKVAAQESIEGQRQRLSRRLGRNQRGRLDCVV